MQGSRFRTAKKLGAIQLTKYDPYDTMNDDAAQDLLVGIDHSYHQVQD
jgi:hypothetical protein